MVVLGGLGNMWGSIIGAAALTAIPEFLRASADYRQLFYGAILVIMMRLRPQGIMGEEIFSKSNLAESSFLSKLKLRLKKQKNRDI
jgi:branched-chain amino acid transport system permease protein